MSIRQRGYRVPIFVPAYLLVIGLGLVAAGVYLLLYNADERFTGGLSTAGGVTMLAAMLLLLAAGRRR